MGLRCSRSSVADHKRWTFCSISGGSFDPGSDVCVCAPGTFLNVGSCAPCTAVVDFAPSTALTCTSASDSRIVSCSTGLFRRVGTPGVADTCVQEMVEAGSSSDRGGVGGKHFGRFYSHARDGGVLLSSVMESTAGTQSNLISSDATGAGL